MPSWKRPFRIICFGSRSERAGKAPEFMNQATTHSSEKKLPPVTDTSYLVRLKRKDKSDEFIAAKMGLTVPEVQDLWDKLCQEATIERDNGLKELRQVVIILSNQFQLLGQSLGLISGVLDDTIPPEDLRKVIKDCPLGTDLAVHLTAKLIVLRPFQMPTPLELASKLETPQKK
jgi:hypothetical protein